MDSSNIISEAQQDLLKELANIGVGNAVTALSSMLDDERIDMEVPVVKVAPSPGCARLLWRPGNPCFGYFL